MHAIPHEMLIIGGAAIGAHGDGQLDARAKAIGGGFMRAAKGPKHNKQDHIDVSS
jgi:chemotaxis protein MotA